MIAPTSAGSHRRAEQPEDQRHVTDQLEDGAARSGSATARLETRSQDVRVAPGSRRAANQPSARRQTTP